MDIVDYREDKINDLKRVNWLVMFTTTFSNYYLQEREAYQQRMNITHNYLKVLCSKIHLPFRKLEYYIQDEIAGGIDKPNGKGHIHGLVTFKYAPKDYLKHKKELKNNLQNVSQNYGITNVKEYDYDNYNEQGIRYSAKIGKGKLIEFSGIDYHSPQLKKVISEAKRLDITESWLLENANKRIDEKLFNDF